MSESAEKSEKTAEKDRQRVEAYRKELAHDPSSLVFIPLAESLNRLASWDEAADVAKKGLAAHPDSVSGLLALAVAEAGRDNVKDALELIKNALFLDQENPRALALMGSLLLQKGLAKRAVQFLNQAAKLDPDSREIADLQKRAKRLAKLDAPVQLPVVRGENVPAVESPWNEGEEEGQEPTEFAPQGGSEHTVFDPDGARKVRNPVSNPAKGRSPFSQLGADPDEDEVTAHVGPGQKPSFPPSSKRTLNREPQEEGTPFDVRNLLGFPGKKPKVGGSAADYSRILRGEPEIPEIPTVDGIPAKDVAKGKKSVAPPPPSESEPPPPAEEAPPPRAKTPPIADAEGPPPSEEKPAKKKGKAAAAAEPPPASADRPATMMVDDAIWALTGGEKPGASTNLKVDRSGDGPSRAPAPSRDRGDEPEGRKGVVVVQSSRWLGTLTYWAVVLVLAGAAGFVGFAMAASSSGRTVNESTEELRGIVADVERGDLAALQSAEEAIEASLNATPTLAPVLHAMQAEVQGKLWAEFGGAEQAKKDTLAAIALAVPSVETLSARVALSTGTPVLAAIDRELSPMIESYPDSPKAWVLRGRIARLSGRSPDALRALARAREIDPARRETLMELARWHVARGSAASAFMLYDEIIERQSSDVGALLDRFVLHQVTGADPDAGQTGSMLAGLVREESKDVAKDEAGRVSLAFATLSLGSGDVTTAIGHLARAESAFQDSAKFRAAVGGLFLAIGEWERSKAMFERAAALEPASAEYKLRASLAAFGKSAGLTRPATFSAASVRGAVTLPFATVRFVPGRFELIEVEPRGDVLPYQEFRASPGDVTSAQTLARSRIALRAGRADDALELLEAVPKSPAVLVEIGRAQTAKGDTKAAVASFRSAISGKSSDPVLVAKARMGLGEALASRGDVGAAIAALEDLAEGDVVMPRAMFLLADLRARKNDSKGALAALEKARAVDPDDARVEMALGAVKHRLDKPDEALAHYQRAIELSRALANENKGLSTVDMYYLGRVLADKNEKRAIALWNQALEAEGAPPEIRYYLGKHLLKKPRTKKAGIGELRKFRSEVTSGPLFEDAGRWVKGR